MKYENQYQHTFELSDLSNECLTPVKKIIYLWDAIVR